MNLWRPQPSPARYILPATILLCVLALAWLTSILLDRIAEVQLDIGVFLFGVEFLLVLLLTLTFVYMSWCAFSIRYLLDDKQLVIRRGGVRYIVPLDNITETYASGEAEEGKSVTVRWRGVSPFVPGYVVGTGESQQLGKIVSIATTPVRRQVFVRASGIAFGLSPSEPNEFMEQLENARREASYSLEREQAPVTLVLSGLNAWVARLWSDKLARRLLIAGLVLNVLFFGYLSIVYADLPSSLALHWDAHAQPDRIGDPVELLRLPIFAAGIWLIGVIAASWTLRRERAVSLFLLGGAAAAQVVFWAGAVSIVLRTL